MKLTVCFQFFAFIITVLTQKSNGERTKDKMYEVISGITACFRRMNGTHQTGCSSTRSGSTGIVHFITTESDIHFLLDNTTAGPYVPVMATQFFIPKIVFRLKGSEKISGLVLFDDADTKLSSFTHEDTCPNRYSNLDKTCSIKWNTAGTGLLNQDYPFPIFYVSSDEDVNKIKDCFEKFNNFSYETQNVRSLCSLELSAFMYATTDTPTCVRRSISRTNLNPVKFCDPLGDENIWASLFPIADIYKNETPKYKYIILMARLDTTSLFHEMMPGAANPVTGLVTLLTTANILKNIIPKDQSYGKNVLFVLLNGETYDYIGSQRLFYDMENDAFPIKTDDDDIIPHIRPENISLLIELSQLSFGNNVVAHVLENNTEVANFFAKLVKYSNVLNLSSSVGVLPPVSLQTFMKNNTNLPGLVLTDHNKSYLNHFYNSIYDNSSNINYNYYNVTEESHNLIPYESVQWHIANISKMVAYSLFEEITNNSYSGNISADITIVNELFHCYLENPNCKIHKVFQKKQLKSYSFYVGVSVAQNTLTSLIGLTLAWLTGDVINTTNKNCSNDPKNYIFRYFNMSKSLDDLNITTCFRSTLNFTEAVSPAFIVDDYNWKSGQYSSWTESTWRDIGLRIFLKPSTAHENLTIAIGSITLIFSFLTVYFIKSRSHILFTEPSPDSPTSC